MPENKAIWSVRGFHHASLRPKSRHWRGMSGGSCEGVAASAGFSLLELLIVLGVALVISAFAIPTMVTTLDDFKLRGAMGNTSNITQRCRTVAIKKDLSQRLHFSTVGNRVVLFVTDGTDAAAAPLPADKQLSAQVWLPNQFSIPGAPAGVGAPTLLTGTIMWGTVLVPKVNVDPYFNSRGLPCLPNVTGVCNATTGFVYYFKYSSSGGTRWTATSISPAGRIQSWFWNGVGWGN